jgi:2-polyprenyl-3-methyl-5-hydroxy-6-metoxy-1,4-benzoquinol methylase
MNGIFTSMDPVSVAHREAIARYLSMARVKNIADYGGGFGKLSQAIIHTIPDSTVTIIDPYSSQVVIGMLKEDTRLLFTQSLHLDFYDAAIAQDVLEHVEDPVSLASQIASTVCPNGIVIFANCFYPLIKCHLPSTFHLRHTFCWVMTALGLKYVGQINGAEHSLVFKRVRQLNFSRARCAEQISRIFGPALNQLWKKLKMKKVNLELK